MKTLIFIIYIAGLTVLYIKGHWVVASSIILSTFFGFIVAIYAHIENERNK